MQALSLLICGIALAAPGTDSTEASANDRQIQASLFGPMLHKPVGWGAAAQRKQLAGIQSHLEQADASLLSLTDVSREQLQLQSLLGHLTQGRAIPKENMEATLRQLDRREQAAVAELARRFQKAAYQAFPRDPTQRDLRIAASQQMFDAWRDAGSPSRQRARLTAWLLEAITATQPSNATELPTPPAFEVATESVGSGNVGPLTDLMPPPLPRPEPLSPPPLSESKDQLSAEPLSNNGPENKGFDTIVRLNTQPHLALRKPLPLDRAVQQPSQERLTRIEPTGSVLSPSSVGPLSRLSRPMPLDHQIPAELTHAGEPYSIEKPTPTVAATMPRPQEPLLSWTTQAWVPMPHEASSVQSSRVRFQRTMNPPALRGTLKRTRLHSRRVYLTEERVSEESVHPIPTTLPRHERQTPIRIQAGLAAEPVRAETQPIAVESHPAIRTDTLVASSDPVRIEAQFFAPVDRSRIRPQIEFPTQIPTAVASERFHPTGEPSRSNRSVQRLRIARSQGPNPDAHLFADLSSSAVVSSAGVPAKTQSPLTLVSYVVAEQTPVRRTVEAPSGFHHIRIDEGDVVPGPTAILGLRSERTIATFSQFPLTLDEPTASPTPIARRPLEFDLAMAVVTDETRYLPAEPASMINLEELQSRIAGCNLELRELEAKLDAPVPRTTDHLAAILSELQLLVARQGDLGLLYDLVPEYQRPALGQIDSTRPILARLGAGITAAREAAQSIGQADTQADLLVLQELSRVLADLTVEP